MSGRKNWQKEHRKWLDIIPGFHGREESGDYWLLYAEVLGMIQHLCIGTHGQACD